MKESNRKIYGTTRANMSTVMNKGVKIHCKEVTANFFIVVGLVVEPSKDIAKTKSYIETSSPISQPSITVTSCSSVIPPFLFISFFFRSMLKTKSRIHQTRGWRWSSVESEVRNSSDLYEPIIRNEQWSERQVEIVSPSLNSSIIVTFFSGVPVSVEKLLLKNQEQVVRRILF